MGSLCESIFGRSATVALEADGFSTWGEASFGRWRVNEEPSPEEAGCGVTGSGSVRVWFRGHLRSPCCYTSKQAEVAKRSEAMRSGGFIKIG
jgi:hypothetical protein